MRAFVGIGLPSSSARAVSAATGPLRSQRHQLRLVPPGNLHLTVAFLGDIERSQQGPIGVALKDSVVGSAALELRLRPPIANPVFSGRVIALAVSGNIKQLCELRGRLLARLVDVGLPLAESSFRPHLTIARVRRSLGRAERNELGLVAAAALADLELDFIARRIDLVSSRLLSSGPIYRVLASAQLGTG